MVKGIKVCHKEYYGTLSDNALTIQSHKFSVFPELISNYVNHNNILRFEISMDHVIFMHIVDSQ